MQWADNNSGDNNMAEVASTSSVEHQVTNNLAPKSGEVRAFLPHDNEGTADLTGAHEIRVDINIGEF